MKDIILIQEIAVTMHLYIFSSVLGAGVHAGNEVHCWGHKLAHIKITQVH